MSFWIWLKLFLKYHALWCTFVGFEPHRFALSGSYIFRAQIKKKNTVESLLRPLSKRVAVRSSSIINTAFNVMEVLKGFKKQLLGF